MSRSFVDLLFILLCATIVLLSQSIRIGTVDAQPAEVGGGAISSIQSDDVRLVIVDWASLVFDEKRFDSVMTLAEQLQKSDVVVLTVADDKVTHHRMMRVWSDLRDQGLVVKFGAKPIDRQAQGD